MKIKEKEMKTSQIYRADSAPEARESALRGLMQCLTCRLVSVTGSATAGDARAEAAALCNMLLGVGSNIRTKRARG